MLSTDQKIFEENSVVRQRMIEYGGLAEELHIIVYTNNESRIKNYESRAGENVFVYPTRTRFRPLYFLNAYRIAEKIIHDSKFIIHNSVITAQDPFETALVGYLLKKKFGIPLQIQSHSDFLSPYFWRESLKNKIRVLIGRRLIIKADGIRVVSERVKQSLIDELKILSQKITVLPIVFDADRVQKQPVITDLHRKYPDRDFIILAASRLTREKNVSMAIEAVRRLTRSGARINAGKILLLIVGDGPERENLELRIRNYELGDNVKIESWTDDIVSYYKTADVFVLTSNYEGGARSPAEAAAAGLPVVMTDVSPAGEVIQDGVNGFVVAVGDSAALAEKIMQLMRSPDQRKEFSKNALATAQQFISREEYLRRYKESLISLL